MRKLKIFSLLVVLLGVITLSACALDANAQEDAYVTLDINPSIELVVSPREKVIYAGALNEDGELLLAGLEIIGLDLEDALDLIIEEAIYLGFIDTTDEEINIEVSTISGKLEAGERIHERAKEHVNNAFIKRAMVGRANDKAFDQEDVAEAETHGVTPGFLKLATSVLLIQDTYTLEELLEMTHEELTTMLKENQEANKQLMFSVREAFHTQRDAIIAEYQPQIEAIEAQLEAEDADVEALTAELETLQTAMREEIALIREEFVEQTQLLAQQMRLRHQERKEMHQEAVDEFMDNADARREHMREAIEEFQNRRNGNNPVETEEPVEDEAE
ncbi:MAG: hypothetical protein ACNA7K_02380 [Acholeplasmataceae bacterium]